MIMKILPLTVHTQHQFGLVVGSDTLSLVAPSLNRLNFFSVKECSAYFAFIVNMKSLNIKKCR